MASVTYDQWYRQWQRQAGSAGSTGRYVPPEMLRNMFWRWRWLRGDPVAGSGSNASFRAFMAAQGSPIPEGATGTPAGGGSGGDGGGGGGGGTTPATPPTNQAYIDLINGIQGQIDALPTDFNLKRSTLATDYATNLSEAGLADTGTTQEVRDSTNPNNPNIKYRVVLSPDGRMYRQAYLSVGAGMAKRGFSSSSDAVDQQAEERRVLNLRRDKALRDFSTQQGGLDSQQAQRATDLGTQLGQAQTNYTNWQQGQEALSRPDPTSPDASGAGGSDGASGTSSASSRIVGRYANRPNITDPNLRVVKRGPKAPKNQRYVVVRK